MNFSTSLKLHNSIYNLHTYSPFEHNHSTKTGVRYINNFHGTFPISNFKNCQYRKHDIIRRFSICWVNYLLYVSKIVQKRVFIHNHRCLYHRSSATFSHNLDHLMFPRMDILVFYTALPFRPEHHRLHVTSEIPRPYFSPFLRKTVFAISRTDHILPLQ